MYSISNAPGVGEAAAEGGDGGGGGGRVVAEVTFSVVRYQTKDGTERKGVATNFLDRVTGLREGNAFSPDGASSSVGVFLRKTGTFPPPEDPSVPIIMVGPGTGVAPFRGYLQLRASQRRGAAGGGAAGAGAALGESWLFFGCRRRSEDYIYGDEFERFAADGAGEGEGAGGAVLSKLVSAFSREGPEKVYVQHLMAEHGAEVARLLLQGGAHVFVCGDGARMAKDVHAALEGAHVLAHSPALRLRVVPLAAHLSACFGIAGVCKIGSISSHEFFFRSLQTSW